MKKIDFIERAKLVHLNKYDYSLITDGNIRDKFRIICDKHGVFEQRGDAHLSGQGCGKCSKSILKTSEEFINEANFINNSKYSYLNMEYINSKTKINVDCPIHGEFTQTPDNHLSGHGCPKCGFNVTANIEENIVSDDIVDSETKPESEIKDLLKINGIEYIENNREILNGKEIDIYIPSHKLGIEFNGLYWHSDIFKEKKYHINKTNECEKKDIQLIQIFEDEWLNKKTVVESILMSKLGIYENRYFARKCVIKEIESKKCSEFLVNNHLQGNVGAKVKIGLFYNNELVSVMTFGKKRVSMGNKVIVEGEYEMLRFCNKLNTQIIGGASKLFKYFLRVYKPLHITTFADRRYSNGKLYLELGFKHSYNTEPNYFYFKKNNLVREYRFKYRKDILVKLGFDPLKTEYQIMKENNYLKIFDSGSMKFELNFI